MNISTDFDELAKGFSAEYGCYNGFYSRPDVRKLVYDLYDGKCAVTGEPLSLEDADIGHIIPRSQGELFRSLYPGLDVDNAINLHLLSGWMNKRNNDAFMPSPLAIHNGISFAAKLVSNKLADIIKYSDRLDVSDLRATLGSPHRGQAVNPSWLTPTDQTREYTPVELTALRQLYEYEELANVVGSSGGAYGFWPEGTLPMPLEESLGLDLGHIKTAWFEDGECVSTTEDFPHGFKKSPVYRDVVAARGTGALYLRDELVPIKNYMETHVIPQHMARHLEQSTTRPIAVQHLTN